MATSDVERPSLDGFDLRSLPDDFYGNPYPYYRALREETPVRQMPDGTLLVTRHRDLDRIYR
ncbi:MAG: cytochrome P450, partial [Pseudomonadota bacterium]